MGHGEGGCEYCQHYLHFLIEWKAFRYDGAVLFPPIVPLMHTVMYKSKCTYTAWLLDAEEDRGWYGHTQTANVSRIRFLDQLLILYAWMDQQSPGVDHVAHVNHGTAGYCLIKYCAVESAVDINDHRDLVLGLMVATFYSGCFFRCWDPPVDGFSLFNQGVCAC